MGTSQPSLKPLGVCIPRSVYVDDDLRFYWAAFVVCHQVSGNTSSETSNFVAACKSTHFTKQTFKTYMNKQTGSETRLDVHHSWVTVNATSDWSLLEQTNISALTFTVSQSLYLFWVIFTCCNFVRCKRLLYNNGLEICLFRSCIATLYLFIWTWSKHHAIKQETSVMALMTVRLNRKVGAQYLAK